MNDEPYNFASFGEIAKWAYNCSNYNGTRKLFELTCDRAFEGYSESASEIWEQRFTLKIDEPTIVATGRTVKEVCDKALAFIRNHGLIEREIQF